LSLIDSLQKKRKGRNALEKKLREGGGANNRIGQGEKRGLAGKGNIAPLAGNFFDLALRKKQRS